MDLIITLLEKVCVIVLLGYVVSRAGFFRVYLDGGRPGWRAISATALIFGLFSIYGTLGGAQIGDAVINVRDAGPMIGGLVGGPLVGFIAGLIGGLHRLAIGLGDMETWTGLGYTCIPCTLSTVFLGLLSGLVRRRWGLLSVQSATLFAFGGEGLHMLLGLLLAGDPARWLTGESIIQSWELVISRASIPMILANGVGVGIFFFALHNYLNELRTTQERNDFYRQIERRNTELQAVYQISQDISASLELDQTLQAILTQVRQMIDYDAAEICLYDKEERALRVRAWMGSEQVSVDTRGRVYRLGEGYTGWIGQRRQSLLIPDVEIHHAQRPVTRQAAEGVPIHAYLGVPLLVGQKLVGALELVSTHTGAFDEHTRKLLETIAPQAAIAIQNAEHVLERERRLKEQIQHLRIEIDEAKREERVAEITETEYFRQLQDKARRLKKARNDDTQSRETKGDETN